MGRTKGYRKPKEEYQKQYRYALYLLGMGNSIRTVAKITGHSVNTIAKLKRFV